MSKSCITCGMPLEGEHAEDIGIETPEGLVCKYDTENGEIKSGPDIFEGGVTFFLESVANGDHELAVRLTRKNMNALPYWQSRSFDDLEGPEATDEEFQEAMGKM